MPKPNTSVVIVGAGASGLHSAGLLQAQDVDVIVFEARNRIGGRLLSLPADGGHVDLGATWFWSNEPRMTNLVEEADLSAFAQHTAGDMVVQQAPGPAQRLDGNQFATPAGRLARGMQSVPETLASLLDNDVVHLEHIVSAISVVDGRVQVTANGQEVTADHVIVAIPPALAASAIDFDDQLPEPIAGLARATPVWMGSTVKVVATFEHAFWRDEGLAGAAFSYVGPMREIHDMSGPDGRPAALFGFCSLGIGDPAPTEADVQAQLLDLYGPDAAEPLAIHIMDWRTETFTSPKHVEALNNYQTYGHPRFQEPTLGGRLHWASTETSTVAPGHIEGALAAAERAVQNILNTVQVAD